MPGKGEKSPAVGLAGDVGGERLRFAADVPYLGDDRFGLHRIRAVVHDDGRPFTRQLQADGPADSAGTASHQRDLSVEDSHDMYRSHSESENPPSAMMV